VQDAKARQIVKRAAVLYSESDSLPLPVFIFFFAKKTANCEVAPTAAESHIGTHLAMARALYLTPNFLEHPLVKEDKGVLRSRTILLSPQSLKDGPLFERLSAAASASGASSPSSAAPEDPLDRRSRAAARRPTQGIDATAPMHARILDVVYHTERDQDAPRRRAALHASAASSSHGSDEDDSGDEGFPRRGRRGGHGGGGGRSRRRSVHPAAEEVGMARVYAVTDDDRSVELRVPFRVHIKLELPLLSRAVPLERRGRPLTEAEREELAAGARDGTGPLVILTEAEQAVLDARYDALFGSVEAALRGEQVSGLVDLVAGFERKMMDQARICNFWRRTPILLVYFDSDRALRAAVKMLVAVKHLTLTAGSELPSVPLILNEVSMTPIQRLAQAHFSPGGWITVSSARSVSCSSSSSSSSSSSAALRSQALEVFQCDSLATVAGSKAVTERGDLVHTPPLTVVTYDTETAGLDFFRKDAAVLMVPLIITKEFDGQAKLGNVVVRCILLTCQSVDMPRPIQCVEVWRCRDQAEMLALHRDLVVYYDADVVAGYNNYAFDMPYEEIQARRVGSRHRDGFAFLGRQPRSPAFAGRRRGRCRGGGGGGRGRGGRRQRPAGGDDGEDQQDAYDAENNIPRAQADALVEDIGYRNVDKEQTLYVACPGRMQVDLRVFLQSIKSQTKQQRFSLDESAGIWLRAMNSPTTYEPRANVDVWKSVEDEVAAAADGSSKQGEEDGGGGEAGADDPANLLDLALAAHFGWQAIGAKKTAVEAWRFGSLFASGDAETLLLLAQYTVMDALLTYRLAQAHDVPVLGWQQSAVYNIPCENNAIGGQQDRVLGTNWRVMHEINTFANQSHDESLERHPEDAVFEYEGGKVRDPVPGLHTDPVVELDFSAEYPSIILQYLVEYNRVVRFDSLDENDRRLLRYVRHDRSVIEGIDVVRVLDGPDGFLVTSTKRMLAFRSRCKQEMKLTKDRARLLALEARQGAAKVVCNANYGISGTSRTKGGKFPCSLVAFTITHYGRLLNDRVSLAAEQKGAELCRATFPAWYDAHPLTQPTVHVVYGDTDSMFPKFDFRPMRGETGAAQRAQALRWAHALNDYIYAEVLGSGQLKLEVSGVYHPLMLTKNKKYGIMVKYSADGTGEGKVVTKGLEANKGDRCLVLKTLTAHIVDMIVGFRHRLIHSFLEVALARVAAMQSQPRQFSIIKKLGRAVGSYEGWEEHVLVARRMLARGVPESFVSRVEYVVTTRAPGGAALSATQTQAERKFEAMIAADPSLRVRDAARAFDVEYAEKNGLEVDVHFYLNQRIKGPLCKLVGALETKAPGGTGGGHLPEGRCAQIVHDAADRALAKQSRICQQSFRALPLAQKAQQLADAAGALASGPRLASRNVFSRTGPPRSTQLGHQPPPAAAAHTSGEQERPPQRPAVKPARPPPSRAGARPKKKRAKLFHQVSIAELAAGGAAGARNRPQPST